MSVRPPDAFQKGLKVVIIVIVVAGSIGLIIAAATGALDSMENYVEPQSLDECKGALRIAERELRRKQYRVIPGAIPAPIYVGRRWHGRRRWH